MRHLLLLLVVAACGAEDPTVPTYGEGLGTPDNPIPQDSVPYAAHTQTAAPSSALTAKATALSAPLRQFAQTPGHSLLTLAAQAAPEELATLDALSSTLRSRLDGWIDTEIDKVAVDGMRARAVAGELADFAEASVTHWALESTLSFTPTKTTHTLNALNFRLAGLDIVVPVGGLGGDAAVQKVSLTVGEGGALTFGEHTFKVEFGAHAWHGINLAMEQQTGAGVDAALSASANCKALGQAVSLHCYSGACVGHASELSSLCERSLAALTQQVGASVSAVDISAIRLTGGTAHLIDDNGDGLANRIDTGVWTPDAALGIGGATFTAQAEGR